MDTGNWGDIFPNAEISQLDFAEKPKASNLLKAELLVDPKTQDVVAMRLQQILECTLKLSQRPELIWLEFLGAVKIPIETA